MIAAGQESASFPIAAVDDGLDTGDKTAIITASVETYAGVVLIQGSAEASLLLKEADGPALSVSFAASTVQKGATATATITRNTDTTNSLVVTLSSSDPTKATVPPTVTIPAGQASVSFTVNAIDDHIPDGLQHVQIFATATGLDTGIATLGITDVDLPDLVVSSVTAPTSGYDNTPLTISWTVTNNGQYPASGSWLDQIYLDPVGGPQSTTPADSVTFTGTVNAGQSYTQTDTIPSPSTVGQYIVRVVTDSGQSVQELSFSNNTGVAAQPFNDQAAYTATVSPSATTVSSGTPVVLSGVATMTSNSAPAADVPVAVQILVAGTTRTLTATTDSSGHYSVTFQPLPNEAGEYSVTAADPGVTNPAVQAQFEIVGMTAIPGHRECDRRSQHAADRHVHADEPEQHDADRPDGHRQWRAGGPHRAVDAPQPDRGQWNRDARLQPRRYVDAGGLRRGDDPGHHHAGGRAQHPAGCFGRAADAGPGGQPGFPEFRHGRWRSDPDLVHGRQ